MLQVFCYLPSAYRTLFLLNQLWFVISSAYILVAVRRSFVGLHGTLLALEGRDRTGWVQISCGERTQLQRQGSSVQVRSQHLTYASCCNPSILFFLLFEPCKQWTVLLLCDDYVSACRRQVTSCLTTIQSRSAKSLPLYSLPVAWTAWSNEMPVCQVSSARNPPIWHYPFLVHSFGCFYNCQPLMNHVVLGGYFHLELHACFVFWLYYLCGGQA